MAAFFSFNKSAAPKIEVVLGVDGGGTKTEVVLCDLQGKELARAVGGPTNLSATTETSAAHTLEATLAQVLNQAGNVVVRATVFGVAGIDSVGDEERFHRLVDPVLSRLDISQFQLENDAIIALANGTDAANAIILIAGTGSICIGRNERGEIVRVGGMDYLLDDEGSGYWIGCRVLRAVVRAADGRSPATLLTQYVLDHFGITRVEELKQVVYQPLLSKTDMAKLSIVWEHALTKDDAEARAIQQEVIAALVIFVETAARALQFTTIPFDLVLAGSIAKLPIVEPLLRARLTAQLPALTIRIPDRSPVYGAIKLALQAVARDV